MIAIASDHGGYDLKERVKKYLEEKNIPYQDMGCDSKASCDYPVFGHAAARAVADGTCEKGIVICTTGIGISISANKVKGDPLRTLFRSSVGEDDQTAQRCQHAGNGCRHCR